MKKRLLAVTWMMPPLIFPRSLQISRTLHALKQRGWSTTVISVPPEVEHQAAHDRRLEQHYKGSYEIIYVEPREDVVPSSIWVRLCRFFTHASSDKDVINDNWVRRSTAALCKEIEADSPDALISFAQPWINHLVGLRVKHRYPNIPWVAHFSDPWVDSPYFKPQSEAERELAVNQEKEIVQAADSIVFTSAETVDLVMSKYPDHMRKKACVVPHGFDDDVFDLVRPLEKKDKFTIIHTGNLYEGREPFALMRALTILGDEIGRDKIQVELVGHSSSAMKEMVVKLKLNDFVTFSPSVSYIASLSIARKADLLLLIDAPSQNSVFLPSKIMDYLALQQPILALTPLAGASARVLSEFGFPVVDPQDDDMILKTLCELVSRWQEGKAATPVPDAEALGQYDIKNVVTGFEDALLNVIPGGRSENEE